MQTLNWKINLKRHELTFGGAWPFAGNTYPLAVTGGEDRAAYTFYVMSGDGLACLAKSAEDGNGGYTLALTSKALWEAFEHAPHETRAFHVYAKNSSGGIAAEGDLCIEWQGLWEDAETGEVYTMRGPQGRQGNKGDKGDKGDQGEKGEDGKNAALGIVWDRTTSSWRQLYCVEDTEGGKERMLVVGDTVAGDATLRVVPETEMNAAIDERAGAIVTAALANYATTAAVTAALAPYATTAAVTAALAPYATTQAVTAALANYMTTQTATTKFAACMKNIQPGGVYKPTSNNKETLHITGTCLFFVFYQNTTTTTAYTLNVGGVETTVNAPGEIFEQTLSGETEMYFNTTTTPAASVAIFRILKGV